MSITVHLKKGKFFNQELAIFVIWLDLTTIYIYMPGHVDFSKFQNRNRSFLAHFYIYTGKYHDFRSDSGTDLRIYI